MDSIETQSRSALASGSIGARFISQNAVDEAKERREEEWKAAYERIGQEPPPEMKEEEHDGRTLYEQLKQDWWDDKMKMKNQYRGLIGEEFEFLAEKEKEKQEKERKVEEEVSMELQSYREARSKRAADAVAAAEPSISAAAKPPPAKKLAGPPAKPVKKDMRSLMKGVVVKKKAPKPADKAAPVKRAAEDDGPDDKKRRL